MATIVGNFLQDSSTLANFIAWAQAVSNAFSTFGWVKSSDTGQVNWASIAAVPGSASYVYEVWQPSDGLANFYVKVEYGNGSGNSNSPALRFTIAQSTNGAGTLTGIVMGPYATLNASNSSYTGSGTSTTYECDFSGDTGRIAAMLWKNNVTTANQQFFSIERSVNSSGAYTGQYVTLVLGGPGNNAFWKQATLLFGVGPSPQFNGVINGLTSTAAGLYGVRFCPTQNDITSAFNGSIPFDTIAPMIGYFDYPCLQVGVAQATDLAEGVPFQATLYGVAHTYLPSKIGLFAKCIANTASTGSGIAFCMRWE